ncbi:hypothetical protein KHA80_14950 [Anaerobacillus sp. HL2]|nr:hypothetical protein KHA80_14950 [Anaerobacillus sp. HL2]
MENVLFALKSGSKEEKLEKAKNSLAKVGLEVSSLLSEAAFRWNEAACINC